MRFDLVLHGGEVVLPNGKTFCDIGISNGKIAAIFSQGEEVEADRVIDVSGKVIMPGVIDAHTHLTMGDSDDPYMTETRSAAIGGVTSVLTYLFQSQPYSSLFNKDYEQVVNRAFVDVGFHFGVATDQQREELAKYVHEYGVTSYKFFMNFRGSEGAYLGLEGIDDGFMYELFSDLSRVSNGLIATHPENIEVIWRLRVSLQSQERDDLRAWTESRIDFVEAENILRALYFAKQTGVRLYIPHLTCELGLEECRRFKERYDRFYVETCTHYLTHTCESEIGDLGKVNPPLRYDKDREALWEGLADGSIQVVGSDHVPRTSKHKQGGIWKASAGFPGLATLLPVMLSEGYHHRGLPLERISQLVSENPAKIFGLYPNKGVIRVGSDADLTVVDLDLEKEVHAEDLGSFCDYTIYEGWKLRGWPVKTIVRGSIVMEDGEVVGQPGYGKYLARTAE
jgi:dihydropyrimidinase